MYVCMYATVQIWLCDHVHKYIYIYICIYMIISVYICVHMYVVMQLWIIWSHLNIYIYIYTWLLFEEFFLPSSAMNGDETNLPRKGVQIAVCQDANEFFWNKRAWKETVRICQNHSKFKQQMLFADKLWSLKIQVCWRCQAGRSSKVEKKDVETPTHDR